MPKRIGPVELMATRRGRDFKISYDSDNGDTYSVTQRTYEDVQSGERLTPITPLFLARVGNQNPPVKLERIQPRYAEACIPNPTLSGGISRMKAVSPYRPTDENLADHLREILSYQAGNFSVEAIKYFSEAIS